MTTIIPDADHAVVFCRAQRVNTDGEPLPSAFRPRDVDTDGLSCDWLEFFAGTSLDDRLDKLRGVLPFKLTANNRLAGLNVGSTRAATASATGVNLTFVHDGVDRPSHSVIKELNAQLSEQVRDAIAAYLALSCVAFCKVGKGSP